MKIAGILLLAVLLCHVVSGLGTISVSFQTEDPATGVDADAVFARGESVQAILELSEASTVPLRFDVTSSLPEVVQVSHPRITFNPGETSGIITLESLPDGKIGTATIIVAPEHSGTYTPLAFDVLVQGKISINLFTEQCVGVDVPAALEIYVDPVAPQQFEIELTSAGGRFSSDMVSVPLGGDAGFAEFTASQLGAITLTATSTLYGSSTLNLDVKGSIITNSPDQLVQNAPSIIRVSSRPMGSHPTIFISSQNAIVTPTSLILNSDIAEVEVIPEQVGTSELLYQANGFCPTRDIIPVGTAALCADGYVADRTGESCILCPGNTDQVRLASTCQGHGTCAYSRCNLTASVCLCSYPYVGSQCQFNIEADRESLDRRAISTQAVQLILKGLDHTAGSVVFSAPGNLIPVELQPGYSLVAAHHVDAPFPSQVDPSLQPPRPLAVYTGMGWTWENTCYENTLIPNFQSPVKVVVPVEEKAFSSAQFYQIELYLYDPFTRTWNNAVEICQQLGFRTSVEVDYVAKTLTTSFCRSGQYAWYIIPNSPPVPQTPVSYYPTRTPNAGAPGTGRTGYQPPPPPMPPAPRSPLPAVPAPGRDQPNPEENSSHATVLSSTVLILLVCVFISVL